MDGRGNAGELSAGSLDRIRKASARVQLVYKGGLPPGAVQEGFSDDEERIRFEGPLNYTAAPRFFAEKFQLTYSFGPELFFGTALGNFGVDHLLDGLVEWAPQPQGRETDTRKVECADDAFSDMGAVR